MNEALRCIEMHSVCGIERRRESTEREAGKERCAMLCDTPSFLSWLASVLVLSQRFFFFLDSANKEVRFDFLAHFLDCIGMISYDTI